MSKSDDAVPASWKTRFLEPLLYDAPDLVLSDEDRRKIDAAFERLVEECKRDKSDVGRAFLTREQETRERFELIWRSYHAGRRAETLAARSRVKADIQRLHKKAQDLLAGIGELEANARRYLCEGYGRQHFLTPPQASDRFNQFSRDVGGFALICATEVDLRHRTAKREDEPLHRACRQTKTLCEQLSLMTISKNLKLIGAEGFQSREVDFLFRLLRCVDEKLHPRQVQSALKKLPTGKKSTDLVRPPT